MNRTRPMAQAGRGVHFAPVLQVMTQLAEWGRRRQVKASIGPLSDSALRDIGLTREDVEAAMNLPLDQDASEDVLREAVARAGNW